jgi:hypothetical protein
MQTSLTNLDIFPALICNNLISYKYLFLHISIYLFILLEKLRTSSRKKKIKIDILPLMSCEYSSKS